MLPDLTEHCGETFYKVFLQEYSKRKLNSCSTQLMVKGSMNERDGRTIVEKNLFHDPLTNVQSLKNSFRGTRVHDSHLTYNFCMGVGSLR
jgi:hypothetical protein